MVVQIITFIVCFVKSIGKLLQEFRGETDKQRAW